MTAALMLLQHRIFMVVVAEVIRGFPLWTRTKKAISEQQDEKQN